MFRELIPSSPSSSMRAWHLGDMNLFILPIRQAPARLDSTVRDSDTLDLVYLQAGGPAPVSVSLR